ncbi:MAG: C40 family peptidase [Propionibacterium sp.]|nr:C40 family peptidase [Propionibacterium sp.]
MRSLRTIAALLLTAGVLGACAGSGSGAQPSMGWSTPSPSSTSSGSSTPSSSSTPSPSPTPSPSSTSSGTPTSAASSAIPTVLPTPVEPQVGRAAWVTVSVATVWRSPSSPRDVDRPALRNPAAIRQWLSAMTLSDRLGLSGRADTQALLGERVVVTARSGTWVKVVVPDQPTPLDARGYPGWVPIGQLTATPPTASSVSATVTTATAWLRTDDGLAAAVVEVSFGTRLPRVGASGAWERVATPSGRVLRVAADQVSVTAPDVPALPGTGSDLVRSATMFTGLAYLWAGTSGFGLDCSGLTSLVYRVHGATIPRDADAQAARGAPVAASALRPGDLLFYASDGYVHHVSMYAGSGLMVQSPHTGASVETIPVSTAAYAVEYAGARRYLG